MGKVYEACFDVTR